MSGSLLSFSGLKYVRPQKLQIHQSSTWNAMCPPLRNGLWFYLTKFSNFVGPAKEVNYGIGIHGDIKALFTISCQAVFNVCSLG